MSKTGRKAAKICAGIAVGISAMVVLPKVTERIASLLYVKQSRKDTNEAEDTDDEPILVKTEKRKEGNEDGSAE